MAAPPRDERGFALLIVLWSTVLLAFIVTGITAAGRKDAQLAGNLREAAIAEAAADGAVNAAAFHLVAGGWPADGRPRLMEVPGAKVSLRVEDEGGKVNPNLASAELLTALLRQAGLGAQAADAVAGNILAWRFPQATGAFQVSRLNAGAPDVSPLVQQYRAAGLAYDPPGAPFESVGELGLVLGMTPPVLDRLRPNLSLLNDTQPDPALASPAVLRALAASRPVGAGAARPPEPPHAVTVVADAVTPGGDHFTRRAGIRLDRGKQPPAAIVTWESGSGVEQP